MANGRDLAGNTPLRLAINTSSATTALVAAQGAGYVIRVHELYVTSDVAQIIHFDSASTELASFRVALLTSGGLAHIQLPMSEVAHLETAANEALNMVQASTNNADGFMVYTVAKVS